MGNCACVYFVKAGDYVKIGMTEKDSPDKRLNSLETDCCNPPTLLGFISIEGDLAGYKARSVESDLHELFADYHYHGEWFWFKPIVEFWYSDPQKQEAYIERTIERYVSEDRDVYTESWKQILDHMSITTYHTNLVTDNYAKKIEEWYGMESFDKMNRDELIEALNSLDRRSA